MVWLIAWEVTSAMLRKEPAGRISAVSIEQIVPKGPQERHGAQRELMISRRLNGEIAAKTTTRSEKEEKREESMSGEKALCGRTAL